ncbi:MAG: chromate transporter [Clostridia bacterium]|nr:chromate transporter [Clostridia bacterium]
MEKFKNSIKLFLTMFKIGLFTFGGGYAMLALLENEFVEKRGWLTKEEFLNMLAIAESTPGPIAINSATYIGYRTAGVLGSAFATLGVCLPSFIIIYIISLFFDAFLKLKFVQYAFLGIRACVVYLIASAGFKLLKGLKKNVLSTIIFIAVLVVMTAFSIFAVKFSTVFYILICGTIGLVAYLIGLISRKGAQK